MSLGELYQQDVDRSLSTMAAIPPDPPKRDERTAWGAPWRAINAAAADVLGSTADVLKGYGAASAMTLEADPVARAVLGDKAVQQGAAEGRRQIATGEALVSDVGQSFRQVSKDQRPDPVTASKAEQIVFGVVRPVSKLVAGGVMAGPFGIVGAAGEEGFTQSEDLREQGVDFATRTKIGTLTAGVNAAGAFLPMAGPTLKATAGLYLLGGPGAFMAQQQATRKILEEADYSELAKQYDPLDPTGLVLSALIPLPFAAHGAARNVGTMRAADAVARDLAGGRNPDGSPSPRGSNATPKPEAAPAGTPDAIPTAPPVPPEVVDAAMVHNLTLQQDVHEAGVVRPETAHIPRARALQPVDRVIENRLAEKLMDDFDAAVTEYNARQGAMGGRVLNTDIARELSPDYLADRTRSAAVHEPASWFIKQLYARKLAEIHPGDEVLFSSGGTGAGKTTAIDQFQLADRAAFVYDTNMNTLGSAVQKVDQALAAGATVRIVHVQRDPVEALVHGALTRAMRQEREFGTGRTVPLAEHARTHRGAAQVLQQLAQRYKDDRRVQITVLDNTRGKGKVQVSDLGFVRGFDYNGLEGKLYESLKQERDAGRISGDVFRGTQGHALEPGDPGSVLGPIRASDGGQPEPQRAGARASGPEGSTATVVTERGLTAPVRYRLVEAADLITSHTNDLTPEPAFPAELQPRDRARTASADQIARIEATLRPELLGESVKASDGAPIIGADGVVESGNARTIALRRAYESGKADGYRQWLAANAQRFGLTADQVAGMLRPVLVRERYGNLDRAEFARQANESAIAAMSPTEQARADAARVTDLTGLVANEDGSINLAKSAGFVRQFMQQAVSPTERGAMLQADGRLSQAGQQRLRNAIFAKAYGDANLVSMLAESTDSNVRNVLAGLMRAAPEVARLRDLVAAGARHPMDVAGDMVRAVQEFSKIRADGMTVDQLLAQGNLFDGGLPPELNNLLIGISENARAPRRIGEMMRQLVEAVDQMGDPRQQSLLQDAPVGKVDLTADAVERMRSLSDEQITDTPAPLGNPTTDPMLASVADRVSAVEAAAGDMVIRTDEAGKPVTVADELARVRREALEGTDAELGSLDADLVRVAADCALAMGTA